MIAAIGRWIRRRTALVPTIVTSPQEPGPRRNPEQPPYRLAGAYWRPGPGAAPAAHTSPSGPYPPRRMTCGRAIANDGSRYRRGLAIAGLAVVVGVIAACATADDLVRGTVHSSPLLTVGECFNETPQSATAGAEVGDGINRPVSCGRPHSDEVVAVLSLARWPSGDGDQVKLTNRCKAELQKYSPSAARDPNVRVVKLSPDTSWKYMNNHTSGCLAHFTPDRVGSIKG